MDKLSKEHIDYVATKTGVDKEIVEMVLLADIEYLDYVLSEVFKS